MHTKEEGGITSNRQSTPSPEPEDRWMPQKATHRNSSGNNGKPVLKTGTFFPKNTRAAERVVDRRKKLAQAFPLLNGGQFLSSLSRTGAKGSVSGVQKHKVTAWQRDNRGILQKGVGEGSL